MGRNEVDQMIGLLAIGASLLALIAAMVVVIVDRMPRRRE